MIGILIWLVIGALIGWIAHLTQRGGIRHGLGLNLAVGVTGAVLGGCAGRLLGLEASALGAGRIEPAALALCLIGAIVALGFFSLFHRPDQAR